MKVEFLFFFFFSIVYPILYAHSSQNGILQVLLVGFQYILKEGRKTDLSLLQSKEYLLIGNCVFLLLFPHLYNVEELEYHF